MESGSGSMMDAETNFSCSLPNLDHDGITDRTFWSLRDTVVDGGIPSALLQSLIFIIATCWNLFIIIVYIIKRELLKEPANLLLFTLGITYLLVCLIVVPVSIIVAATGEFILGNSDIVRCTVCSIQGFFFIYLTTLFVHFLAMLSVDRCILLSNPLKYRKHRKAKVWLGLILLVWVLGIFIAILPAIGFGEWEFNRNFGICLPRWLPAENFYYMALVLLEGFIPVLVIIFSNVWTWKIIRVFLKNKLVRQTSFKLDKQDTTVENLNHKKQQKQLVRVFGALLISNIATWTPIMVMLLVVIITRGEGIPDWLYIVCWFFYLINPLVLPILESLFIKELRTRINKAKHNIHRASTSLLKLTTRSTLKSIPDIPDMPDTATPVINNGQEKEFSFPSVTSPLSNTTGMADDSFNNVGTRTSSSFPASPSNKVRFSLV